MTAAKPTKPPWHRLEGEPDDAWQSFCEYRDQDAPRNARFLDLPMAKRLEWYTLYKWGERCAIFDDHIRTAVAQERAAFLRETTSEIGAKHMQLLAEGRALVSNELKKILATSKASELEIMKPKDLSDLLSKMITLDRLVRGETTSNEGHDIDLAALSPEELRAWQTMIAKTKKK